MALLHSKQFTLTTTSGSNPADVLKGNGTEQKIVARIITMRPRDYHDSTYGQDFG